MNGRIFDIQRFSTHDGPGIRTTVFFKGCPLRCHWCHNPEGVGREPQVSFAAARCVCCGDCVAACAEGAHRIDPAAGPDSPAIHVLDRGRCRACGTCVASCPGGALEMVGRDVSVSDVLKDVLADRAFYVASGGGLTLSGGEPLAQPAFAAALVRAARDHGIHCCIETSGFAAWEHFHAMLGQVGRFLFDYKETDPQRHLDYTGVSNEPIIENLRRLHAAGAAIELRCPIIPGANDREDHFSGIATLARELPGLQGIELIPYHPLGHAKAERLGLRAPTSDGTSVPERTKVQGWVQWFLDRGIRVECRQAGS